MQGTGFDATFCQWKWECECAGVRSPATAHRCKALVLTHFSQRYPKVSHEKRSCRIKESSLRQPCRRRSHSACVEPAAAGSSSRRSRVKRLSAVRRFVRSFERPRGVASFFAFQLQERDTAGRRTECRKPQMLCFRKYRAAASRHPPVSRERSTFFFVANRLCIRLHDGPSKAYRMLCVKILHSVAPGTSARKLVWADVRERSG